MRFHSVFVQYGVYLFEFLLRFVFVTESRDYALSFEHFFAVSAQFALSVRLFAEHRIGMFGDESRDEERERRYNHDYESDRPMYREHYPQSTYDGERSRQQLREALQDTVGYLFDVVAHAGDQIAVRVRIDIGKRQSAYMSEQLLAHFVDGDESEFVGGKGQRPLEDRADGYRHSEQYHKYRYGVEFHEPFFDYMVYRVAYEHRRGESGGDRHHRRYRSQGYVSFVRRDVAHETFEYGEIVFHSFVPPSVCE